MTTEQLIESCKDMPWQDVDKLIDELEILSAAKFDAQNWDLASKNINNFLTK